jgi:multiple sugar transport system ATP-binding protein
MASVAFERVTKRYTANTAALSGLDLQIRDTEFMVLVGPSGCGKSTALRMLAGLEDITEGAIKIGERVVNDVPARDRDIAMVFQSYGLYPHMTVYQNMAFGLRQRHTPKPDIEPKVREASRLLGLDSYLQRKPRQLSGGQRQRVALGRAIVRDPQVFLLDEPLSNLDAQLRVETRINLQKLHRDLASTFVYVTHDQVEAMTMGDRIAVLKDGVLQQVASPSDIYDHPANMYVAGFIGSPKMNFIHVTIDGTTARAAGFQLELPRAPGIETGMLGVRPEEVTVVSTGNNPQIEMKVEVVESSGSDQFLYGTVSGDNVIARVDPHLKVATGDLIRLTLNVDRLHLFDTATEKAVL